MRVRFLSDYQDHMAKVSEESDSSGSLDKNKVVRTRPFSQLNSSEQEPLAVATSLVA